MNRHIVFGARTFFVCLLTLWGLDVIVSLQLLPKVLLSQQLQGRSVDFMGMAIADAQLALAVTLLAVILIPLLRRIMPRLNGADRVAVPAGVLAAFAIPIELGIITGLESMPVRILTGTASGLVVWLVTRRLARTREEAESGFTETLVYVAYPSLLVALGIAAIHYLQRDPAQQGVVNLISALAALVLFAGAVALRNSITKLAAGLVPVVLAFVLAAVTIAATARFGESEATAMKKERSDRPNIVLIVLDTVRADHIQLYGYARQTMPNLEAFARQSVLFPRALSAAGWTAPSHASMLSGRPVSLHGIHYAATPGTFMTDPFDDVVWLPKQLLLQGYYTLAVTANKFAVPATHMGFRRVLFPRRFYWSQSSIAAAVDNRSPLLRRLSERLRWRNAYADAEQIVETVFRAVPDGDAPLFLLINFMDAHAPYNPPASALEALGLKPPNVFRRYSTHRELTRRWSDLPEGKNEQLTDTYDGSLHWIDRHLGRLLEWIDRRYGSNTVVIITSDHGEELGEEGRVGHEWGLPQRVVHVPLMVRAPHLEPGTHDPVVSTRSIPRFVRAVANGRYPAPGVLTPSDEYGLISERYPSSFNMDELGPEYGRFWIAMIDGRYKGIGPSDADYRLFDIVEDGFASPVELSGPEGDHIRRRIDAYWDGHLDRRDIPTSPESEEELKRLRALGYIK